MPDLLDGIARYLQAQGLVTYDPDGTGGDCFIDTLAPVPDGAVALGAYGLGEPDPLSGDDEVGLQVRVRGGPDPRLSRRRALAIYSALHGLAGIALPDGTWLILAVALQTPTPLGTDGNGRHEHVVNFRLNIVNPTANRG
ncbi:minor capsid protein [Kitasatospora sp. NPDC058243]|uniref:minor capsid protein n=1 Tax=Kitasatospora sp. NPDC058243 TaxID=3346397 RepID=UPI0036DCE903